MLSCLSAWCAFCQDFPWFWGSRTLGFTAAGVALNTLKTVGRNTHTKLQNKRYTKSVHLESSNLPTGVAFLRIKLFSDFPGHAFQAFTEPKLGGRVSQGSVIKCILCWLELISSSWVNFNSKSPGRRLLLCTPGVAVASRTRGPNCSSGWQSGSMPSNLQTSFASFHDIQTSSEVAHRENLVTKNIAEMTDKQP